MRWGRSERIGPVRTEVIIRVSTVIALLAVAWTLIVYEPRTPGPGLRGEGGATPLRTIEQVNAALEDTPDDFALWTELATRLLREPDPWEALERWKRRASRALTEERCGEGLLLMRMGNVVRSARESEAAPYWEAAADALAVYALAHPERCDYFHWYSRAFVERQIGRIEDASASLDMQSGMMDGVWSELSRDRRVHHLRHLAEGYMEVGRLKAALPALRELRDESLFGRGLGRVGISREWISNQLHKAGDTEAALVIWEHVRNQALERDPSDLGPEHWNGLAWSFAKLGRIDRARDAWERAVRAAAEQVSGRETEGALFNLAGYRVMAGDIDGGIEAWLAAVEAGWSDPVRARNDQNLSPVLDDPRFLAGLAEVERRLDRLDRVVPMRRELIQEP